MIWRRAGIRVDAATMAANDELAVLRQRLEDETRRRQEAEQQLAALTAPKRKKKKRCILDDSDSDSDGEDGGGAARVSVSQSPPRQLVVGGRRHGRLLLGHCCAWRLLVCPRGAWCARRPLVWARGANTIAALHLALLTYSKTARFARAFGQRLL